MPMTSSTTCRISASTSPGERVLSASLSRQTPTTTACQTKLIPWRGRERRCLCPTQERCMLPCHTGGANRQRFVLSRQNPTGHSGNEPLCRRYDAAGNHRENYAHRLTCRVTMVTVQLLSSYLVWKVDMEVKAVKGAEAKTKPVSFGEAFWFWVKLGFINFGGPAGQIAIMHRELVEKKRWISESQYLRSLTFCMLLPGPEAQQVATYIGWRLHGTLGGIVAGSFFVIPSIFVLLLLSYLAVAHSDVPAINGLLYGVQP